MMKVVIQNPFTLSYLQSLGKWTYHCEEAFPFESSARAIQFCREHELSDMQVVLKFPNGRFDVELPVSRGSERGGPLLVYEKDTTFSVFP